MNIEYEFFKIPDTKIYKDNQIDSHIANEFFKDIKRNPKEKLFTIRNQLEDKYVGISKKEIEDIKIRDDLFMKFCELLNHKDKLDGIRKKNPIIFHSKEERLGMCLLNLPKSLKKESVVEDLKDFETEIIEDFKKAFTNKNPYMINVICKNLIIRIHNRNQSPVKKKV